MRALHGFVVGANVVALADTFISRAAFSKPSDPLLLWLMVSAILLNGYYAFRPVEGAEDDSGEGCQSERGHSEAGRE
jgi:hypothetical protein